MFILPGAQTVSALHCFNTSYVNVYLFDAMNVEIKVPRFNTSYVNVYPYRSKEIF